MISLFIFIFILGILIIVHEFGHFMMAKKVGVRVEKFSLGFGPQLFKKKKGDTEYSLSAIPLGGYVKLAGDSLQDYKGEPDEYLFKKPNQRAAIIFFGPLLNYLLGFLCLWFVFATGYPMLTTKVGGLIEGFGAQQAGIKAGDRIVAIDGQRITFWEEMQRITQSKKGAPSIKLVVLRDNKEYNFEVKIQEKELGDMLGQKRKRGLLGITPEGEITNVRYGLAKSFLLGLEKTYELTVITYKSLWRIIVGKLSLRESVTGPLGIFYITSKAAEIGVTAVIQLVAVLSLSLAIFNLLPLPILDGGHILFLAVEKVRGRRLGLAAENIITRIGLALIISLAILVTYIDVWRIFGDKIAAFFK